jgi:glycosyltransferase involved in cell wall biosynthesis
VQDRIREIYGRDSVVIFPPVDTDYFTPEPALPLGDYFLIVSRMVPYKRIDLAVDAFSRMRNRKLVIVGEGRDLDALRSKAGENVLFLGYQTREVVRDLLRRCQAFLFPGLEDFGIAPVEAMAVGRPVIAFAGGGALDTVVPGRTGELFDEQVPESLLGVLEAFDPMAYDPGVCRAQAERFSRRAFQNHFLDYLLGRKSPETQLSPGI